MQLRSEISAAEGRSGLALASELAAVRAEIGVACRTLETRLSAEITGGLGEERSAWSESVGDWERGGSRGTLLEYGKAGRRTNKYPEHN